MTQRRNKMIYLRKEKGLTQKDIVELLENEFGIDITESYYGMIEQGARTPKLRIALAISSLFDTSPSEIFFEEQPNEKLGIKTA